VCRVCHALHSSYKIMSFLISNKLRALTAQQALACAVFATGAALVPAQAATAALQAVPSVDLARYIGKWYQIAYYPNNFQKQCVSNTTAEYANLPKAQIQVTNTCKQANGTNSVAVGAARVKQPKFLGFPTGQPTTSKLEVRFAPEALSWIPGVWAPYWVIQLPEDYRYAVVSEPSRKFLWILSRTPALAAGDREAINAKLLEQGFDLSKLKEEPQN
jgi:apolipoprotein D and lipocalin family protein